MRHIDEDSVTQAVIARHAAASDARLRELVTSLVQHLHAFAREVRLTEDEWALGLRALAEAGSPAESPAQGLRRLSDVLGLSTLVVAMNHRKPPACTPSAVAAPFTDEGHADAARGALVCVLRGHVRRADGQAIADAELAAWPAGSQAPVSTRSDAQGRYRLQALAHAAEPIPHEGPAGRLLEALGRSGWRPARLRCRVRAPGFRTLHTELFRQGDRHLDNDAAYRVRSALIVDWQAHEAGATPDGSQGASPLHILDYDFVLDKEPTA